MPMSNGAMMCLIIMFVEGCDSCYFCNSMPMSMPSYDLRIALIETTVAFLETAEMLVKKFKNLSES